MSDGKLVFIRPADGTGRLVFNDDSVATVPDVSIGIDATFAGETADMPATVQLLWDAGVSRGEAIETRIHWQEAQPTRALASAHWQDAERATNRASARWQDGQAVTARTAAHWQDSQPLNSRTGTRWQDAQAQRHATAVKWQEAQRMRGSASAHWQDAQAQRAVLLTRYQEAIRLRSVAAALWQGTGSAQALRHQVLHSSGAALPTGHRIAAYWQDARRPPAGLSVVVQPPVTPPDPCYDPATLGRLEFTEPWANNGKLVFICVRGDPLPALIVIPIRSRYVTYNSILLRRVAGDIALNASSVDLSIDHKSWTWSWSAGLEKSALALLAPEVGEPVEMELSINGVPYRLYSEEPERQRKFPRTRVGAAGRGLACELDGDDVVQQYFSAATDRTAQQLANEALTVNGVGIGWDIDWQLTDWLVPGGVWSHMGTHISAVSAIAAAAGGYVQPHPTARTLRVLPGYPAAPWDWGDLTPDIELPAAPVTLENIRWHKRPAYNRVFVSGEGRSTIWDVTRGGTAGLIEAPMVVDQLATHADASRQRGIAVLGDTGLQALVTLSLPVLQETGLILPGKLVRYVDGPTTRLGLVRSCAIEWRRPTLRQRINLETHI